MTPRLSLGATLLLAAAMALLALACEKSDPVNPDPYHGPAAGEQAPDVVVVAEEPNTPVFDLVPTEVNGQPLRFNDDNKDNDREPLVIPPERMRFYVKNVGTMAHDFHVVGPEVIDARTSIIGPKRRAELTVELQPGRYTIACFVDRHHERGMKRPLIVDPAALFPPPPLQGPQ